MNLGTILADVYRRCGYAATPATDVATRITAFVNETQREILEEPGLNWLYNDQILVSSVVAQAEYELPSTVQSIKQIRDTTNRRTLQPMSLGQYRGRFPNPIQDPGTPEYYVNMGMSAVFKQMPASGGIGVISTSAGDNGTAYVEGFESSSGSYLPFSSSVAMTGVAGSAATFSISGGSVGYITKFYVSMAAAGRIHLIATTNSVILSRIPVGYTAPRYYQIALVPTPVAALDYTVDYERTVSDMTISTDEPLIPFNFHRLLAIGARAKEYEKQNQLPRMQVARGEYVMGLDKLKYWALTKMIGSPNLRSNAQNRPIASAVNVATS
jgi:hypothetical protein